jgi:hypothetical protein
MKAERWGLGREVRKKRLPRGPQCRKSLPNAVIAAEASNGVQFGFKICVLEKRLFLNEIRHKKFK